MFNIGALMLELHVVGQLTFKTALEDLQEFIRGLNSKCMA